MKLPFVQSPVIGAEGNDRTHGSAATIPGAALQEPKWMTQLNRGGKRASHDCISPVTRVAKRGLDIAAAVCLLIVSAPVLCLAALAIRLTSRGPVFFTQTRVGLNNRRQVGKDSPVPIPICRRRSVNYGRPFTIYKLRTMRTSDGNDIAATQKNDERVFPVGRFLRQFRIDELPQLVNVIKGDMSMVGPRPECVEYMESLSQTVPNYLERLGLKPGLTGIAQIESGYANDLESYQRKIAFDLMYLRNCCVRNDLKIMVRTARVVVTGFGAI